MLTLLCESDGCGTAELMQLPQFATNHEALMTLNEAQRSALFVMSITEDLPTAEEVMQFFLESIWTCFLTILPEEVVTERLFLLLSGCRGRVFELFLKVRSLWAGYKRWPGLAGSMQVVYIGLWPGASTIARQYNQHYCGLSCTPPFSRA